MIFFILIFSFFSHADIFTVGSGSEFRFKSGPHSAAFPLSIYIVQSSFNRLKVEYHFADTASLLPSQQWQQYEFKRDQDNKMKIVSGRSLASGESQVKKIDLQVNQGKGVEISQFLFGHSETQSNLFVKKELVEVPAGQVEAKKYEVSKNGQTVQFWISDQAKPIGLVKLVSRNPQNTKQNYSVELQSLIKSVSPKIK